MELYVDFIDDTYYDKHVEVNDIYVTKLCGQSAMNMLFEQEEDDDHKSNNFVIISQRCDLPYKAKTTGAYMSVSNFTSDNFLWYCIDKEYLLEIVKGESN